MTLVQLAIYLAVLPLLALGILRMPDIYMRMSCNAKAVTIGLGQLLLALALHFGEIGVTARALATIGFVVLTIPVASHLLGRASYLSGQPLWQQTSRDEWGGDEAAPRK
ncbi:MAG TPA: monovalent cation/H(+) antiporter subunit G [Desulfurivibrio alkaliphilus]|uniref:Monovalent cation/H(+) antiporter subunit G n=1 Tax=Desulfurivibrio alkaliphilus TaxID=427923 RepID=A0A7C2XPB2_9BACT|nr:monovalent cation/H(+) antiporter subunit G [Desulfurivibrio alkaliphilus]